MTPLLVAGRLEIAMAEEFENYEARLEAARRAVERWEEEGGAKETEHSAEDGAEDEPTIPPGEPGEATHDRGEATER